MKLWGSGCQSSLHLQCQDSQAWFKLETKLGHPASPNVFPPFPVHGNQHDHHQQKSRRRKGPGHLQNDCEWAATDLSSLPSVATADTSTSASDAVSAVSDLPPFKTPIPLVASTGNSCPPQPRPAVSAGPEPLPLPPPPPTPPPPRTAFPPRTPSPCPEESGSAETVAVAVSATFSS